MIWSDLTIVTACTGYGQYLRDWTTSILAQAMLPGRVCIFTHGSVLDNVAGMHAAARFFEADIPVYHEHCEERVDLGEARNRAVALSESEWVLHLDADDTLMPHALAICHARHADADVISAGYERSGRITSGTSRRSRVYEDLDGILALDANGLCSSNSPFRRRFWEQSPYRTDMYGAWDIAFWIGLARLGARFRATPVPIFYYRLHPDSIFARRQRTMNWGRVHTTAMLTALRRNYDGVAVVVPRDFNVTDDRARNWNRVASHYAHHHPLWSIVQGRCPSVEWHKGAAIADALNHTNASILVLADADCIVDPVALEQSVLAVQNGAPWAMPHHEVYRATEELTRAYCASDPCVMPTLPDSHSTAREPYEGAPGGGIVVISRVHYDAIGGIPYVFCGWGSEDRALALLCETLLGPCVRGTADLLHLYHDPQPKTSRTQTNLQMLRRLGHAAQQGKDALVMTLATLARTGPGARFNAITSRTSAIPHPATVQEMRQSVLTEHRRRMP